MNKTAKIILILILMVLNLSIAYAESGYEWAEKGIRYCTENGIMQGDEFGNLNPGGNLTREQMAKMLSVGCNRNAPADTVIKFSDVSNDMWSYSYILNVQDYIIEETNIFRPFDFATREDLIACIMYASGLELNVGHDALSGRFLDAAEISANKRAVLNAAVFHGYVEGDARGLRPQDNLTRAEACVLLERILNRKWNGKTEEMPNVLKPTNSKYAYTTTPIKGVSVKTMEQAISWAKRNNAAQIFIDVAPLYWKYGDIFGVRADILYAQAAKETAFGRYTGRVKPEMNNWAGIKKYGAVGDETYDHETFATPEDGVRGHFNHLSAYIGINPVGETHGRYKSVKSLSWAGTVEYVEQLGGKWCPDVNYGYSILNDYVNKM